MTETPRPSIGEYLIDALRRRGVNHVFGVPGDFILGLYEIGEQRGMRMVNSTREEAATYAADGYAREKGLGAVAVTFGVGILATMAALGAANSEGIPLIVIGGAPGLAERDGRRIHHYPSDDVNTTRRMMDEITVASVLLDEPDIAFDRIDWLLDTCIEEFRPGYIELPRDMISAVPAGELRTVTRAPKPVVSPATCQAAASDLAEAIRTAERPLLWVGQGARHLNYGERVMQFAERTGLPVIESVMGKGFVNESHPQVLGVYAGAGTEPRLREFVEQSDLIVGLALDINDITTGAFSIPVAPENTARIFNNGTRVGHRTYLGVTLMSIAPYLAAEPFPARQMPADVPYAWSSPIEDGDRITTDIVADRLQRFVEPSDIVISDVGVGAHLAMDVRLKRAGQFHIERMYVGMGFAVPAAAGTALARGSGRPIVLVGDGSFQMTGFDLSTAIREGIAPIVLVLDNHGYGAERSIRDGAFNEVAVWDYAAVGAVVGAKGAKATTPAELDAALAAARADTDHAHIIQIDLDRYDVPRALRALGEGLASLMEAD